MMFGSGRDFVKLTKYHMLRPNSSDCEADLESLTSSKEVEVCEYTSLSVLHIEL
jgi:hypothetical protein